MRRGAWCTIPHNGQRYDTVGDYTTRHGMTMFTISEMENPLYGDLVLLHELVEKILVDARGIKDSDIDAFDMAFEAARPDGNDEEPGWDTRAPYHKEHVFAEKLERLLAEELGIDWTQYDRTVVAL